MAAASDFGLSQNPTGKRRPSCCPKIIDAEHAPLAGSFRFALAGGSVSCQKFTTMSQILDYYRKRLGTAFDDEKYHFEVNGGTPVSFKELTQKLEDKSQSVIFKPDPLVGFHGETRKAEHQFSLLKIENIPQNRILPGLLLKDGDHHHLLIHHDSVTTDGLDRLQAEIYKKLRHIGCKPAKEWGSSVCSSAQVLNPLLLNDKDDDDLWMKHRDFRFFEDLEEIKFENDVNAIIGKKHRFLCKGGSFLIVAPSGVGKSTLLMQMAISWSAGRDFFGLEPTRELRCFLLQGENDDGDVAEMAQGIKAGLRLSKDETSALKRNFAMQSKFGLANDTSFPKLLRELIHVHQPDVIFVDPLFAFLQGNFIEQEFISENFRRGIDPVLKKTGCILVSSHHTPKPAKETPRTGGTDFSYSGFGTSELTNWYRAVATLRPEKGLRKTFRFIVAKRGARAGFSGGLNYCLMRHSEKGLFWEKVASVVVASPDGPLPTDEYEALKLVVKIKSDQPETRDELVARIMQAKKVKDRQALNYWAKVRKYFLEVGNKYIFVPPEEKTRKGESGTVENESMPSANPPVVEPNLKLKPQRPKLRAPKASGKTKPKTAKSKVGKKNSRRTARTARR
jgi:hypothetical protein